MHRISAFPSESTDSVSLAPPCFALKYFCLNSFYLNTFVLKSFGYRENHKPMHAIGYYLNDNGQSLFCQMIDPCVYPHRSSDVGSVGGGHVPHLRNLAWKPPCEWEGHIMPPPHTHTLFRAEAELCWINIMHN